MAPPIDPDEHTVPELRAAIDDVEDPGALAAILPAERAGDDRKPAVEAIEDRLRAVDAEAEVVPADSPVARPAPNRAGNWARYPPYEKRSCIPGPAVPRACRLSSGASSPC